MRKALIKHDQHLYLLSRSSIELFFRRLGVSQLEFEPARFGHSDMFLVAARTTLANFSDEQVASFRTAKPSRRIALTLIDMDGQRGHLEFGIDEFRGNATADVLEGTAVRWRQRPIPWKERAGA